MRQRALSMLVVFVVSVSVSATNLAGVWTLDLDPDFGGVSASLDCTLKQNGRQLAADCGGGPTISGDVDGSQVTLLVKTGQRNELTATFKGNLNERETLIIGTWHLTDDAGKREGQFTLRKQ